MRLAREAHSWGVGQPPLALARASALLLGSRGKGQARAAEPLPCPWAREEGPLLEGVVLKHAFELPAFQALGSDLWRWCFLSVEPWTAPSVWGSWLKPKSLLAGRGTHGAVAIVAPLWAGAGVGQTVRGRGRVVASGG